MESLLIGIGAGLMGAALAVVGFGVLVGALPLGALAENARLDWTVFWASMAAALVSALLVAVVPGVVLWRGSSLQTMLSTTRTGGVRSRGGRLEGGLVVAQMALAVLLVAGAGLLIRSVANLRGIDPGVRPGRRRSDRCDHAVRLTLDERRRAILAMLPSLEALPGVRSVAAAQKLPLRGSGDNWGITIVGRPPINATTAFRMVTPDYFGTLGIPITRGRDFDALGSRRQRAGCRHQRSARGQVLSGGGSAGQGVADVRRARRADRRSRRQRRRGEPDRCAGPRALHALPAGSNRVQPGVVRPAHRFDRAASVLLDARSAIGRESSQLAVQQTTTMKNIFDLALGPTGQVVTLVSLLAGLALVLGAVGVYGVISHYVGRRSREYGIRIALGQQPLSWSGRWSAEGLRWSPSEAPSASPWRSAPRACSRRCSTACGQPTRRDGRRRRSAAGCRHARRIRAGPPRQPDGSRSGAAPAVSCTLSERVKGRRRENHATNRPCCSGPSRSR